MSLSEKLVLKRSKAKSLDAVQNLNVWGCQLTDVNLLAKLPNIEVLNLSCNNIVCLKELRSCHKLKELYIRCNQVYDFSELEHLSQLPNLKVLWLAGNPLSSEPNYKQRVIGLLPQITKLDNVDTNSEERILKPKESKDTSDHVLQAVMLLLSELDHNGLETVQERVQSLLNKQ